MSIEMPTLEQSIGSEQNFEEKTTIEKLDELLIVCENFINNNLLIIDFPETEKKIDNLLSKLEKNNNYNTNFLKTRLDEAKKYYLIARQDADSELFIGKIEDIQKALESIKNQITQEQEKQAA